MDEAEEMSVFGGKPCSYLSRTKANHRCLCPFKPATGCILLVYSSACDQGVEDSTASNCWLGVFNFIPDNISRKHKRLGHKFILNRMEILKSALARKGWEKEKCLTLPKMAYFKDMKSHCLLINARGV
mmetsp:Transcript_48691/g.146740  ORF Transcript_48691/g.146740 Transcript_48691/m.146740 type:complete len:128 (-) Transcript_48691:76-459(-)